MLLSHHVTVEQRQQIQDAKTLDERRLYQAQLNKFVERLFIENRLQRSGEQ